MTDFNWQTIRSWNGSQFGGFEELCAQLARAEIPEEAKFHRKGTHDAGVECFCVLPDGLEWGWQAKYLFDATKMTQFDDSVKAALDKHPRLVRYFVCMPIDRSDARATGRVSALQRWEDCVRKWQGWARDRCMDVEFVWWGASELIDRLSRNEHSGRRFFWFSQHEFGQDWFRRRLQEAVRAAGPRYTPDVHIDLSVAQDIERFSRSVSSLEYIKSLSLPIRRARDRSALIQGLSEQLVEALDLVGLSSAANEVLDALSRLEMMPTGKLPLAEITEAANKACDKGQQILSHVRRLQYDDPTSSNSRRETLEDIMDYVYRLQLTLQNVTEASDHANSLMNSQLLILRGDGGAGKTHLLCNFAQRRLQDQLPTLLLMGQRFLSDDDPWTQLLQQLDLSQLSADEFVGSLESAAQASNSRVLIMVDALNEGNGRKIWMAHLSSFMARLCESRWVSVVLSIRSCYEEIVIPENVRAEAEVITHPGFAGNEFDATRIFFSHYNIESPASPILQPEFSNPLFLKAICEGLQAGGHRRIPTGFHGITAVFDIYLKAVHKSLSGPEALDYDPNTNLVRKAIEKLAERLAGHDTRQLPRSEAQDIVNELLPGRDYSKSLYTALVTERVLIEDMNQIAEELHEEIVSIAYDRLADHIIADHLLNAYLDVDDFDAAFSANGGLAFLCEKEKYVAHGLLEALCVQVPERTGKELLRLAPGLMNRYGIAYSFLQSIVWRRHDAFSKEARAMLNEFVQRDDTREEALDTMMSVSTVPDHPFNANSLTDALHQSSMPDRDAIWSIYLHNAWRTQSPVDRLVDWAVNLSPEENLDAEVVDLAAISLAWMFTTSNRFLRDGATKALVNLLTGRLESATRLVDRFRYVNDPYVAERVYAVAYGVALRSDDAGAVGRLASAVYEHIFASETPTPPHILLRDYARGVIERAIYLGVDGSFNSLVIRPPYKSTWPNIPSEEEVETLTPKLQQGSWDSGSLEWSRNRIHNSVIGEYLNDFARYVIGTESEPFWLSLRLDERAWQSPEERINALVRKFDGAERDAYEAFKRSKGATPRWIDRARSGHASSEGETAAFIKEMESHQDTVEMSQRTLMSTLTEEHRSEMESIGRDEASGPPRFDVRAIQRYVLWRVFDLGWTIDRFGKFDRFSIGDHGRSTDKAERIGKKYQWIAYHEILAYISDHYQYREPAFDGDGDCEYEGPWQLGIRDIDPSCTMRSTRGGTSWGPHAPAWWGDTPYTAWADELSHQQWLALESDIPEIEELLQAFHPGSGDHWLNVYGHFVWMQPHPVDVEPYGIERRQLSLQWDAYLLRSDDVEGFVGSIQSGHYSPRSLPSRRTMSLGGIFLGEYGWRPALERQLSNYSGGELWVGPDERRRAVVVRPVVASYEAEAGGFDCSIDEHYMLLLPHSELLDSLGLNWVGKAADYRNETDALVAFDPTAHEEGPTALVVNKALLEQCLEDREWTLCWVVNGEKFILGGAAQSQYQGHMTMSGIYRYTRQGPKGYLDFNLDLP